MINTKDIINKRLSKIQEDVETFLNIEAPGKADNQEIDRAIYHAAANTKHFNSVMVVSLLSEQQKNDCELRKSLGYTSRVVLSVLRESLQANKNL